MVLEKLFQEWQDLAVSDYRQENISTEMFDIGYYDDYVGSVEINQYDALGNKTWTTRLVEAFPSIIGDVALDWNNGTEILVLPVSFSFRYYTDKEGIE